MTAFPRRILRAMRRRPATARVLDHVGLAAWHLRRTLLRQREHVSPDATRLIHPRPSDIQRGVWRLDLLQSLGLRRQRDLVGLVRGGDWDLDTYPLDELGIFEAIRQRFGEDRPWEEIPYFAAMRRSLDAGVPRFKYRSRDDIPRQWRRIEDLHERIRREGFRSQRELGSRRPWDEITVAVDRHGRLLFLDGRHRLAIARVLGCARVPALVGLRHDRWEELRRELGRLAGEDGERRLPAHCDLPGAPWPPVRDPALPLFLPHVPAPPGPVLDLEPGFGYWCQQMEAEGYDTFALPGPTAERLDRLRLACELETRLLDRPAVDQGFSLALALGGGEGRLWDLPEEALRHRLEGLRVRHLVLRLPPAGGAGVPAADLPAMFARILGLAGGRQVADDPGRGRLVLLSKAAAR